ncbi:hypothetical protein [Dyella flagellata]|uniref:Uncharacterized protein n=1 Tax=Dyella flagellata TaxID=1867833 RepID=A0ABQ5XE53_9GAMM|nr:hypothetical protein [Dyella flagellata]GLQ89378.1 hypothetical protein GCM10007898_29510 [Dyella flagellata]
MKMERSSGTDWIGLGLRAIKGGGVVVGMVVDEGVPRIVLSTFIPTAASDDRLALEPYRAAYEMQRGPHGGASAQAVAAVAEGHKRQCALATRGLGDIVCKLHNTGYQQIVAALLVNRAGWIIDTLAYSLAWPEHVPIAEGLAVRDALRFACGRHALEVAELDEKSLHELASKQLRLSPHDLDIRLKSLGATAGRPWRKEQKLACLSAWVTLTARQRC